MSVNEVKMFYVNDIVYRFDKSKKIVFGIVLDSYESTESDSDDLHSLKKGQIRVYWLNNSTEQVCKQSNVKLMSRSIIPGDIVRRFEHGKETQRGYCQSAKQVAVVQIIGTDMVIENVTHDRLANVTEYEYGAPVCCDKQFGRVQTFDERVTLLSKCGSIVEILQSLNMDVEDYWLTKHNHNIMEECNYFYPGQEVTAIPSSLEVPNWIKKSKIMKRSSHHRQRFTVQKTDICNVEVAWQSLEDGAKNVICDIKDEEVPKLKVIESTESRYLELAERKLIKLTTGDVLIKKRDWISKQSILCRSDFHKVSHLVTKNSKSGICRSPNKFKRFSKVEVKEKKEDVEDEGWTTEGEFINSDNESTSENLSLKLPKRKYYPPKTKELVEGSTVPVEILCMDSYATIVWQDGTKEKDVPTTQLYFSISLDDHEFFPGEWVVNNDKSSNDKFGVIQKVDYLERTAKIQWFIKAEDKHAPPIEDSNNEMSVYDIIKHPKFVFRPGSVVYKVPAESEGLGTVIDSHPEGVISVRWISNVEEKCWPTQLEVLSDSIDEDDEDEDVEMSAQVSWETESIETIAGDLSHEPTLQNMAARLDFIRSRIVYLKDSFQQHNIIENSTYLRDLLVVYENSSYLDKLLDTSFFNSKSRHYQALLQQVRERCKGCGVELRSRSFSIENQPNKAKTAERENLNKVLKLEHKINAHIESAKDKESGEPSTPLTPETDTSLAPQENLCVEILSMLKARMDLAYAEIISRIGGSQALSVMTKASESVSTPQSSTPYPSFPTTPDDSFTSLTLTPPKFPVYIEFSNETYSILDEAPTSHRFYNSKIEPKDKQRFFKSVQKEGKLLQDALPQGVWVRSYANRLDLLTVMIRGPNKTPYEDGLFVFDLQLSSDYPRTPPLVSYISYSAERLNPNLYVEGRVCISLLGTWMGEGSEVWGPNSTLLQLIVSIQGLILVAEPYYNEAGYEKQCDSQQGYENSRTYNELVILKLVQSMTEMLNSPPIIFKQEIYCHFNLNGSKMCERLKNLINDSDPQKPEFPLLPVSRGFKLSLNNALNKFQEKLNYVIKQNALK